MSINFRGDHGFKPVGTPRWYPSGWELDQLVVPMQGAHSKLNAYLESLIMWTPSTIDGNMFLSDWSSNGDQVFPTVDLTYIGKKKGRLPPDKHSTGRTVQQASIVGKYIGPTSSLVRFSRDAIDISVVSPAEPANVIPAGPPEFRAANQSLINQFFKQYSITTGENEELVPGEYYRAHITKTMFLYAILDVA